MYAGKDDKTEKKGKCFCAQKSCRRGYHKSSRNSSDDVVPFSRCLLRLESSEFLRVTHHTLGRNGGNHPQKQNEGEGWHKLRYYCTEETIAS